MTGPEHYKQAEALVNAVMSAQPAVEIAANMLAAAQVHATLAQVAALAEVRHPEIDGPESLVDRDRSGHGWSVVER